MDMFLLSQCNHLAPILIRIEILKELDASADELHYRTRTIDIPLSANRVMTITQPAQRLNKADRHGERIVIHY